MVVKQFHEIWVWIWNWNYMLSSTVLIRIKKVINHDVNNFMILEQLICKKGAVTLSFVNMKISAEVIHDY